MITSNLYLNSLNITKMSSNINLSDNIDALGAEFSFDIAREYYDGVELGNLVIFKVDGNIVFQGIVVAINIQELSTTCTCFDFAWYLNKSTVVKQYKNIKGIEAIKSLCTEMGVKVKVEGVEGTIDCIYKDKTISEVIQDILNKSTQINGKRFNLEMDRDTLVITPFKKIVINPIYHLSNDEIIQVTENVGSVSYNESIEELKNSVVVVSGDEKAVRFVGNAKDEASIKKYGQIQSVVSLDAKEFSNADEIAKTKLKELNRITQNISLSLLGDFQIKSGRVLTLKIKKYRLDGDYLIKSTNHSFNDGIHKVDVNVEVFSYG